MVGNEGIVGIAVFMGGESTTSRAIVQSAGHAYKLAGQRLRDEFNRHADLQGRGLINYTRGNVRILDRKGLEAMSCECYEVFRTRQAH